MVVQLSADNSRRSVNYIKHLVFSTNRRLGFEINKIDTILPQNKTVSLVSSLNSSKLP